jgi:hypothetical protein
MGSCDIVRGPVIGAQEAGIVSLHPGETVQENHVVAVVDLGAQEHA